MGFARSEGGAEEAGRGVRGYGGGEAEEAGRGVGEGSGAEDSGVGGSMDQGEQGLTVLSPSSGPGSPQLSSPSPLLEEMLAKAVTQRKSPREERGLPPGPDAHPPPLPQEEDGGPWPEGDGAPSPSDATDRGWLPIEARRLSQPGHCGSQPSPPREDFAFLEVTLGDFPAASAPSWAWCWLWLGTWASLPHHSCPHWEPGL